MEKWTVIHGPENPENQKYDKLDLVWTKQNFCDHLMRGKQFADPSIFKIFAVFIVPLS